MAKAAIPAKVEPTDPSFLAALHFLQNEMIWARGTPGFSTPSSNNDGGECPRVVKALPRRNTIHCFKQILTEWYYSARDAFFGAK